VFADHYVLSAGRFVFHIDSCACFYTTSFSEPPFAGRADSMGDCVPAIPAPTFCDMVSYNVTKDIHTPIPDPNNIMELDDIAKDIYFSAIEVPRIRPALFSASFPTSSSGIGTGSLRCDRKHPCASASFVRIAPPLANRKVSAVCRMSM
jgi:hypothetical protein